jgi:hypothetical protein
MAVWTVFPRHATSRGRPTFTESRRGIARFSDICDSTASLAPEVAQRHNGGGFVIFYAAFSI